MCDYPHSGVEGLKNKSGGERGGKALMSIVSPDSVIPDIGDNFSPHWKKNPLELYISVRNDEKKNKQNFLKIFIQFW